MLYDFDFFSLIVGLCDSWQETKNGRFSDIWFHHQKRKALVLVSFQGRRVMHRNETI